MKIPKHIQDRIVYKKQPKNEALVLAEVDYVLPLDPMCEDCGRINKCRTQTHRWIPDTKFWLSKCDVCNLWKNEETQEYTESQARAKTIKQQVLKGRR